MTSRPPLAAGDEPERDERASSAGKLGRVIGVGLWAVGYPTAKAWKSRTPDPSATRPKADLLDRPCARRASTFSKALAAAFAEAAREAEVDLTAVAAVFGSSLGETSVMLKLLEQMQGAEEDFSPMLFAVSVHNAASGLVSISTKNRAFTTSLAADHDTPAMGLLEAAGVSRALGVPAVLVCGDEAAPKGLVSEPEAFADLAVAVVIDASEASAARGLAELYDLRAGGAALSPPADVPDPLAKNPQVGLFDLVDAVLSGRTGRVRLDRGKGRGFSVEVRGLDER